MLEEAAVSDAHDCENRRYLIGMFWRYLNIRVRRCGPAIRTTEIGGGMPAIRGTPGRRRPVRPLRASAAEAVVLIQSALTATTR